LTPDFLDQMLSAAEDPFYGSYMTNSMRANGLPLKKTIIQIVWKVNT